MTPPQVCMERYPKDKVIWEAFYGDGKSESYFKNSGFNVIHEPVDFFTNDLGEVIVTNPKKSKLDLVFNKSLFHTLTILLCKHLNQELPRAFHVAMVYI